MLFCLRMSAVVFSRFWPLSATFHKKNAETIEKKNKATNCQTPCLLASLSFNMCEVLFKEVGMGRVPGTLLLRTISIQNPFMRYSFERAWYSFKKMSLSVCVCACVCNISFTRNEHFDGICGGQNYLLLAMDMAKVGGPLSVVKVFTRIWTSQFHFLLL